MKPVRSTVVLVNVYSEWRGPSMDRRIPLGMLYLGGSLKGAGYGVRAYHMLEEEIDEYLEKMEVEDVLFTGVTSIMTGFSLRAAMTFSKKLRARYPRLPILWGGVQPSSIPEICLQEDYVDGVGMGEGEETIVEIAKAYQGEMEFSAIKGFAYKNSNGEIVVNKERDFIKKMDTVFPDYSLINLEDYIFYDGQITGLAMSSRGCPYDCSFCYNSGFNHRRWRAHSEEFVVNNILELRKKYSFSRISFSDDNFMVNKERAFSILQKLRKAGIRTYSMDLRIKGISDDDVKRLNEFEVISVFFGTESLNPKLLKLIQKEHTRDDVIAGLARLNQYPNINAQSEILIGMPFESKKEMIQDIQEGLELYKYHRNFSLYFGAFFPLPGTKMFGYARANGFNPTSVQHFSEIDLINVWRICHQWIPWAKEREKRRIFWTERFSQLIQLNKIKRKGLLSRIMSGCDSIQFSIAKMRLVHQCFLGSGIDFFISRSRFWLLNLLFLIMGQVKKYVVDRLVVDPRVNYRNFGYIPTGSVRDIRGKLFGHVNLLKRLQARDIMSALDIKRNDVVLDLGCGAGYFTVEMAKLAQKSYGVDITPSVGQIKVPSSLVGRFNLIRVTGEGLPFREKTFDKVLASEVLPMVADPSVVLSEIRRVLRPRGLLIVVNGGGHPVIRHAFEEKTLFFRTLQKVNLKRMPPSYQGYCSILQKSFKTAHDGFLSEKEITDLLKGCGFEVDFIRYTPSYLAGAFLSWSQFFLYLRTGKTLSQSAFPLKYHLLRLVGAFDSRRYPGGILCRAMRKG